MHHDTASTLINKSVYNDNSIEQKKLSISEMAGCRLYLEALKRKERLALDVTPLYIAALHGLTIKYIYITYMYLLT